jgi:hypothetical protein
MKHIGLLFSVLIFCVCPLWAEVVFVDGVYYDIDSVNQTAKVTFKPYDDDPEGWMYHSKDSLYVGDVVIPSQFTYDGLEYSVVSVGDNAFAGSGLMTTLQLPASVVSFGSFCFTLCQSLSTVNVAEENPIFLSSGGIIYEKEDLALFFAPRALSGNVQLLDGIKEIPSSAFQYCRLDAVVIPNSVEEIKDGAFNSCPNLTEVQFGSGLKVIGREAFANCPFLQILDFSNTQLKSIAFAAFMNCEDLNIVYLSDCLETISGCAFQYCDLIGISLPATLTTIEEKAFWGCERMTTVINNSSLVIVPGSETNGCVGLYLPVENTNSFDLKQQKPYLRQIDQTIYIYNVAGEKVKVYDLTGKVLFRIENATGDLHLKLEKKGLYIVEMGNEIKKISLR